MADITGFAWFPVVTLLMGFAAGSIADYIKDRRLAGREERVRRQLREEELADRRAAFQRTTLIELQEVAHQIARDAGRIHALDMKAFNSGTTYWKEPLPEILDEAAAASQARSSLLMARVKDERVRSLMDDLKQFQPTSR